MKLLDKVIAFLACVVVTSFAEDNILTLVATLGGGYGSFLESGHAWSNKEFVHPEIPDSVGYVKVPGNSKKITGYGTAFDIRLGARLESVLLYANVQSESFYGNSKEKRYSYKTRLYGEEYNGVWREDIETDENVRRFFLGMGLDYYPMRGTNSIMKGSFVGLSVGVMVITGGFEFQGLSASADLGYIWNVGEHLNIGVSCVGSADAPIIYGESTPDHGLFTIWLGVRFESK